MIMLQTQEHFYRFLDDKGEERAQVGRIQFSVEKAKWPVSSTQDVKPAPLLLHVSRMSQPLRCYPHSAEEHEHSRAAIDSVSHCTGLNTRKCFGQSGKLAVRYYLSNRRQSVSICNVSR